MHPLSNHILEYAAQSPEGTILCSTSMLHLGSKTLVSQSLSNLAKNGYLVHLCSGIYVRPVETRFGQRLPDENKVIESLSKLWGDTIVPSGGAAANALGLTTQIQVKPVYLTSGRGLSLRFGQMNVVLRHAPRWQLVAPHRTAGNVIRALAWLGAEEIEGNIEWIGRTFSADDVDELVSYRPLMPTWIANPMDSLKTSA